MMNHFIKNICLISFALIGPISLPAGGIQTNSNMNINLNKSKEIILNYDCSLYCFPKLKAKKLRTLYSGSSLSILRKWTSEDDNIWIRVELDKNVLIDNSLYPRRGWIKI